MDKSDRVVGEKVPVGIEFPEEIEIVEEPVSFGRAELKIHPDIAVFGVIVPGDDIMQATDKDMEAEEYEEGGGTDHAFPDESHFQDCKGTKGAIKDQQKSLHIVRVRAGSPRWFLFFQDRWLQRFPGYNAGSPDLCLSGPFVFYPRAADATRR